MEIQFLHMFQEPFPFNTFFGAARRDGDWHACPYFSNFLCLGFGVHSIRVSLFSPILRTNSRLLACVRSFGVRQLAAAFSPASLLAAAFYSKPTCGRTWYACSKPREQARGEESGSKLPHSKASHKSFAHPHRRGHSRPMAPPIHKLA